MIISAKPYPCIGAFFSKSSHLDLTHVEFHFLGRDAVLSGLIASGLQKGDGIIVPAYMCDSTIKPLQVYGFNLVFIDIEKDLSLSVDKLKKVIKDDQIKALLVVHYFGLTQNIAKVVDACSEHGIKIIEDASHSFLSQFLRDKNSIKGDVEAFSMRKSLPISDGGALRINYDGYDKVKNNIPQCVVPILGDFQYLILRFLEKIVIQFGVNIYAQFISDIKIKLRSKNNTYCFNINSCQPSWQLKKYLGSEKYLQNTQQTIVDNFNQLSQALRRLGFSLFVESVGQNVVPQACIVYDDKGGLVDYLRSKGIGAWRWPDEEMPEEVVRNSDVYPNTMFFNENLVLIPIHQSLGGKQINYIIQTLSRWQL